MITIPGYTIQGYLPDCDYDTIYLASRNSDSLPVVIKTAFRSPNISIHTPPGRLLHEIQLLKQFHHPLIIKLYDYGVTDNHIYCVTEYFRGGNLKNKIATDFDSIDSTRCLTDLVRALSYLHARDILHLDINPTNVGIRDNGSFCLFDFGIAFERLNIGCRSKPGTVTGTPSYLAPEQIAIPHKADYRTDIYSLGCVMYEVFTGKRMYHDEHESNVLKLKLSETDRDFDEVQPPFNVFLHLCVARRPSNRFLSCDQIQSWLEIFFPKQYGLSDI